MKFFNTSTRQRQFWDALTDKRVVLQPGINEVPEASYRFFQEKIDADPNIFSESKPVPQPVVEEAVEEVPSTPETDGESTATTGSGADHPADTTEVPADNAPEQSEEADVDPKSVTPADTSSESTDATNTEAAPDEASAPVEDAPVKAVLSPNGKKKKG